MDMARTHHKNEQCDNHMEKESMVDPKSDGVMK